jgi:alkylhydroperoxidase/carboxymuconolactone decarboxylase family protein YurZ
VHDDLVSLLLGDEDTAIASTLDTRTAALARVAATIAIDAGPSSFQHAVAQAIAAGATTDEIVATLEAVTPVTGTAHANSYHRYEDGQTHPAHNWRQQTRRTP